MNDLLNISEIFLSIQGEAARAGLPCAFVRLAGCNLRCDWCDTTYAQTGGTPMGLGGIVEQVESLGCSRVEVTGGEPLTQPAAIALLAALCDAGYETLLETNGSQDISQVDPRVVRIVDFKCPASGESERNLWANVEHLTDRDEVKFVIAGRGDYDFARSAVADRALCDKCAVIFSPVADRLAPAELSAWILADKLDVRVGIQLHKMIFPGKDRGV